MNTEKLFIGSCVLIVCLVMIILIGNLSKHNNNNPYFVVTEMVQCKGNICNAVLDMDDIAILVPYDCTKVHVGDTLYITK